MNEMNKINIGVAVIAKNEADRITRLVKSVSFAKQIVVVDSGSTDGTQALCNGMGVKVIHHEWAGFAAQKQFAMEQVASEWILNLDADEEVSEGLSMELTAAIPHAPPDVLGFSIPRLSNYLNRWVKHGGWYPDRKVRLVRKGKGRWIGDQLHEQLAVDGRVEPLSQPILHHVYRDISDQVVTINRFSTISAGAIGPAGRGYLALGLIHAVIKFLECYIWKLGIFDGMAGLVIAANSSWYVFLRHAKAWELGLKKDLKPK
ncbi:MAG: hypothetical protein A2V65_04025 [Deltaproteobacteria bacterium RBG_13_49_15]|nr:MAG: hypothetical protein A2V65_04025 [Deltaproteobacteria bacterium RBG_13_49_15]